MGGVPSNMWATWTRRDEQPNYHNPPTFDPLIGFPDGRKQREMKITHEEMEAARIPFEYRDYCAHLYVKFMRCRQDNHPWPAACKHERHEYDDCEYQDYILRMKEYEREKRLLRLKKKKVQQQQQEMLE